VNYHDTSLGAKEAYSKGSSTNYPNGSLLLMGWYDRHHVVMIQNRTNQLPFRTTTPTGSTELTLHVTLTGQNCIQYEMDTERSTTAKDRWKFRVIQSITRYDTTRHAQIPIKPVWSRLCKRIHNLVRASKAPYTLSVKMSDFTVWSNIWRKNWVNCAVLTGNI